MCHDPKEAGGSKQRGRARPSLSGAVDHDLEHHAALLVPPTREERKRVRSAVEGEAVGHERLDAHAARAEQAERLRVRVRVPERALDVDLAQRGGRERQGDVARAHADEHDLATGDRSLWVNGNT
jgi:hypothetical protein